MCDGVVVADFVWSLNRSFISNVATVQGSAVTFSIERTRLGYWGAFAEPAFAATKARSWRFIAERHTKTFYGIAKRLQIGELKTEFGRDVSDGEFIGLGWADDRPAWRLWDGNSGRYQLDPDRSDRPTVDVIQMDLRARALSIRVNQLSVDIPLTVNPDHFSDWAPYVSFYGGWGGTHCVRLE